VIRRGHLGREDIDDVEAAVLETELDERESRGGRMSVGEVGVEPDPLLAGDLVGEGGEIGRGLVDAVVDPRRRVHLSHAWPTRAGDDGSGGIGAIGHRLPEYREVCGTVAEPYAGADRALGGELEVSAEAEGRTTSDMARGQGLKPSLWRPRV